VLRPTIGIPALQKEHPHGNGHASTAIEGNPLILERVWKHLDISRQGAMNTLTPLIEAGLVEKRGTQKSGRYFLTSS